MRAIIQRVKEARVEVEGQVTGSIGAGLVVLVGISKADSHRDADYLADRILSLRIFSDESGKMNPSVVEVNAGFLIVSNFTVYGDCRKGERPRFEITAGPGKA